MMADQTRQPLDELRSNELFVRERAVTQQAIHAAAGEVEGVERPRHAVRERHHREDSEATDRDECANDRIVRPEFGGQRPLSAGTFHVTELAKHFAELNSRPRVTRIRLHSPAIDRARILESAGRLVRHAEVE